MSFCKTKWGYTLTRVLNTPFWALYTLLPVILYREFDATPWQIACIFSSRPIAALFSLYWSAQVKQRHDKLVSNIVWASVLGHLPFFFAPWISHPWYFVAASAVYMLFHRGGNPAWMELLKINLPEQDRKGIFAYSSAIYHAGGALLAIVISVLLDDYFQAWRWLFPVAAGISLSAIVFQAAIPVASSVVEVKEPPFSLTEKLKKPWQDTWALMKERPDFARFQIGFMLGGGGLMLWQPALPKFFIDVLHLNYTELSIAMTLCKSIGYAVALPFWTRLLGELNIYRFSSIVTAIAAFFPLCLMAAEWNLVWLYVAYLLYGAMQGGSEMSWNLSGPIFSKHDESSLYTGVNVVSVGLRGCVAPPLGSLLCNFFSAAAALSIGGGVCLLATWAMAAFGKKEAERAYRS